MGWNETNSIWRSLNPYQRAAAIALMEPNTKSPTYTQDAQNSLGAIINRSEALREPLSRHVERANWYQPLIEPTQEARLKSIIAKPEFQQFTDLAERRASGTVPDWVGGATHYLAKPQEMLELERNQPNKYLNWGPRGQNWTGYDPATGKYANQVLEDGSHSFLLPKEFGGIEASSQPSSPPPLGAPDAPSIIEQGVNRAIPVAADTNPFSANNLMRSMADGGGFGAQAGNALDAANNTAMQEKAHLDLINSMNNSGGGGGLLSGLFGGGGGESGGGGGDLFSMLGNVAGALGGGGGGDSPPPITPSPMIGQLRKPVFDAKQLAAALAKRNKLGSDVQTI